MLAVDAEVPSTGVHLHAFGGATASGTPTGSVAIEQRLNRAKWWIEGQPLRDGGRVGAGFAVTHPNVAIGASYSENLSSNAQPQQGTGSKDMNVWGTVKIPGLMLGTRFVREILVFFHAFQAHPDMIFHGSALLLMKTHNPSSKLKPTSRYPYMTQHRSTETDPTLKSRCSLKTGVSNCLSRTSNIL
jgi:hypothetical protein